MVLSTSVCRVFIALLVASVVSVGSADSAEMPVTPPHKVVFKVENLENGKPAEFIVEVHPEWSPLAAEHFMKLVKEHYFDGSHFHRVLSGFSAQFGIAADPSKTSELRKTKLQDEPLVELNTRGRMAFVPNGPNSRSTQLVINEKQNEYLDHQGYVPFATVSGGMAVVDRLYGGYGATAPPKGRGPSIERIEQEGAEYLMKDFPKMSFIRTALVLEENFPQVPVPPRRFTASALCLGLGAFVMAMIAGGGYLWSATLLHSKPLSC